MLASNHGQCQAGSQIIFIRKLLVSIKCAAQEFPTKRLNYIITEPMEIMNKSLERCMGQAKVSFCQSEACWLVCQYDSM